MSVRFLTVTRVSASADRLRRKYSPLCLSRSAYARLYSAKYKHRQEGEVQKKAMVAIRDGLIFCGSPACTSRIPNAHQTHTLSKIPSRFYPCVRLNSYSSFSLFLSVHAQTRNSANSLALWLREVFQSSRDHCCGRQVSSRHFGGPR